MVSAQSLRFVRTPSGAPRLCLETISRNTVGWGPQGGIVVIVIHLGLTDVWLGFARSTRKPEPYQYRFNLSPMSEG